MRNVRFCPLWLVNTAHHPLSGTLSNLEVPFSNSHCASVIKSTNHGIVWHINFTSQRILLDWMVNSVEKVTWKKLMKKLDRLKTMHSVRCDWGKLHLSTMMNAFHKAWIQILNTEGASEVPLPFPNKTVVGPKSIILFRRKDITHWCGHRWANAVIIKYISFSCLDLVEKMFIHIETRKKTE